jgi:drug/metabolite transporter superfamily protein YnfA
VRENRSGSACWSSDLDSLWSYTYAATSQLWAAYGGVFVVAFNSLGLAGDQISLNKFDLIGGAVALAVVLIIMYWPRNA